MQRNGLLSLLLALLLSAQSALAQPPQDGPRSDPRTAWFREAKFGMFIHWGLYSVPAGQWKGRDVPGLGEWIMHDAGIPVPEYEKLAGSFDAEKFDARQWVAIAKDAGMTYVVVTAKHHDGFCMWGTKVTPYNVVDATPLHRDPLKDLAAACKEAGIKFCCYYSIMDWRHPELFPGPTDPHRVDPDRKPATNPDDPRVIDYVETQLKPQLRELVLNYDPAVLWFDGEWVPWWEERHGKDVEDYLRHLKPGILVNNRIGKRTNADGDFDTSEQESLKPAPGQRLWETCMTLNDTWGYKKSDHHWKRSDEIVKQLAEINASGGNLLLNVGPTAQGVIPRESVEILHEIGAKLRQNDSNTKPQRQ